MDVLSCSLHQLEEAENEVLGELRVLERQALAHLQGAASVLDGNGDKSGGINLFRVGSIDEPVADSFGSTSGSFPTEIFKGSESGLSKSVSLGKQPQNVSNRDHNALANTALSCSRNTIGLGHNFNKIESFGNRLKTIANESDCALNKLKCAVNIVECVSVLYQSASKLMEFFTEFGGSVATESGAADDFANSELQLGRLGHESRGLQDAFELSLDGEQTGPNYVESSSSKNVASRSAYENINFSYNAASMELIFDQVKRYIEQVESAKKNGYWNDALIVISKGYIGQVISNLKWIVLRYLRMTLENGSSGSSLPAAQVADGSGANSLESKDAGASSVALGSLNSSVPENSGDALTGNIVDRQKLLTRLAVCLGSETEVFKCYISAITSEFGRSITGSRGGLGVSCVNQANLTEDSADVGLRVGGLPGKGDPHGVDKLKAGNEVKMLKNTLKRARKALVGQASVVLSELGGSYYIQICREIHHQVSSEVANLFVEFVRLHFGQFLQATAPISGASNRGDKDVNVNATSVGSITLNQSANGALGNSHNSFEPNANNTLNGSPNITNSTFGGSTLNSATNCGTAGVSNRGSSAHGTAGGDVNANGYSFSSNSENLHIEKGTSGTHASSRATNLEDETLLSQLEGALEDASVVEAIVEDAKYQAVLDTIAVMASLWTDFECALRASTRPVYSKLNISLLNPYSTSGAQASDKTSILLSEVKDVAHANTSNIKSAIGSDAASVNDSGQSTNNQRGNGSINMHHDVLTHSDGTYGADGLTALSLATKTLQSLLNVYVQLQHAFILKYVQQAIQVDAIYQSVSTLVDDVFFILQKSQQRSIATGDLQTACATFNQTSGIIGGELKTALVGNLVESRSVYEKWVQKLDNLSSSSIQNMLEEHLKRTRGSVPDSISSKHSFVHSLNNVEECLVLLEKFKQEMTECFTERFFNESEERSPLVDNAIQALDTVGTELEEILDTCCEYVFNILKDHLNDPLLRFNAADFEMDEEAYSRSQNEESFADHLVSVLNVILGHLSANYAPRVGLKCTVYLIDKLSKYLETSTLTKRFSVYGAVHFDAAIRSLIFSCSSFNKEIRKQFSTLLQISDVLNVNNRDDLMLLKESEYTIDISKYSALRTDLTF